MISTAITRQIEKLEPWTHSLNYADERQAETGHFLGDFPSYKWQQISRHLPLNMSGMRVLDIGCNAGYYSIELAKRGADVTAIDIDDHYLKQARRTAESLDLKHKIDFRKAAIYQLMYDDDMYDLIWFMGVFYHLRYPTLALDIVRNCCRGQMIFQTLAIPGDEVLNAENQLALNQRDMMNHVGWPRMAFIEPKTAADSNNWWIPNHACVTALLRAAGFRDIERIAHETYCCYANEEMPTAAVTELQTVLYPSR